MSSLRPESNKSHQLGSSNFRWKSLHVGGIDANEQVKIDPLDNNQVALVITGSMELKSGDISLYDANDNNKEYKVLETLLDLSTNLGNAIIDETNLVHISGTTPETISNFKYFTGGVEFTIQNNSTYKINGTIDSNSDDGTISTTAWVNDKLQNISISNASLNNSGKVRLATQNQIDNGIDTSSGDVLVVQPSQMSGSIHNSIEQLRSEIASGLIYKGALEIIDINGTNVISPNTVTGSLQGDFYYIKTGGVISSSTGTGIINSSNSIVVTEFTEGDLVVFKDDATGPLIDNQFDIIQNSFNFTQIKNLLENNTNQDDYIAKNLYVEGIVDTSNPPNKYTTNDILKTTGINTVVTDSLGNKPTYNFLNADFVKVPTINYDANNVPTQDVKQRALNIYSLVDYLKDWVKLGDLNNVDSTVNTVPQNGHVLTYVTGANNDINKWLSQPLNVSTDLKGLTDVSILEVDTDPSSNRDILADGQGLIYSASLGKWVNSSKTTLPSNVAYTSSSLTPQKFSSQNQFVSGVQNTSFNIINTLVNPVVNSIINFPTTDASDYNLNNTVANSSILKCLFLPDRKDIPSINWVTHKSLKKVNTFSVNANISLVTNYNSFGYSESLNNFSLFNDFIWNLRPINNTSNNNTNFIITLPTTFNTASSNASQLKSGFCLTIKNIPNDITDAKLNPDKYILDIKPQAGQYIDFELDEVVKLVPFSSLTFVISDGGVSNNIPGWIII